MDTKGRLVRWIGLATCMKTVYILLICACCLSWNVHYFPSGSFYNNTMDGFYNPRDSPTPIKPPRKRDTTKETQRALFLICGVILGLPLGALAACGVREFVCAMWEKYRIEALRRNYLYRMKVPTTVPVR